MNVKRPRRSPGRGMRYKSLPVTKKRPSGTYTPVTSTWQERVRAELKRRGWNQGDLAQRLKCSDGAISMMLAEGARSSRLVDQTNLVLDIASPVYDDDFDQQAHLALKRLRKQDRDLYDKHVQDILRAVRNATTSDDDLGK